MTTSVKGLYEKGVVKLLDKVDVKGKVDVVVTFTETIPDHNRFYEAAGAWRDIDAENLKKKIYQNRALSSRDEARF